MTSPADIAASRATLSGQSGVQPPRRDAGGSAPARSGNAVGCGLTWLRRNLFSSAWNTVLTLVVLALIALALPPLFRWAVSNATISGATKAACGTDGACWTFIRVRFPTFFYGRYPVDERWRVNLSLLLMVGFLAPVMSGQVRRRGIWVLLLLTLFPLLAGLLLVGGVAGLAFVDTSLWGGLMLDVIIALSPSPGRCRLASRWRSVAALPCRLCVGCRSRSSSCGAGCRC